MGGTPRLRRAVPSDAAALVRLRALMFQEMGTDPGGEDAEWRGAAEVWFAERLGETRDFAAFVVEDPALGVVCNAAGACDRRAPGPADPGGRHGHVFNISTDTRRRRRGHARACLGALLAWFHDEAGCGVVDLNATGQGIGLYHAFGFEAPRFPALRLRLDPVSVTRE